MIRRLLALLLGTDHDRSPEWPRVRREHLAKQPACAACGDTSDPQVHHIQDFHRHRELELVESNLLTLCGDGAHGCHLRIGHSFRWDKINPHCVTDAALQVQRIRERR